MVTRWMLSPSCTVRKEEDGTGFAFNANDDRLYPLNKTAIELMRHFDDGAITEDEIFSRMWPHMEEIVRNSVREDFRAFLFAMAHQGCLKNDEETQPNVDMLNLDKEALYSPPQIEELRPSSPGLHDVQPEDRMRRRRFLTIGAGALATIVGTSKIAHAATCGNGSTPPLDDQCSYGTTPRGQWGDCLPGDNPYSECRIGYSPDSLGLGDCKNGVAPDKAPCSVGEGPLGEYGDCSNGEDPSNGICTPHGY